MALAAEVGELMEIFQWLPERETTINEISEKNLEKAKEELADIFLYFTRIADKLEIDIIAEANRKIESNSIKYPIDLAKGNAIKFNRRNE